MEVNKFYCEIECYVLCRNINSKAATKSAGCEQIKSGKESQNNEIEVKTEINEGKNNF